jgi:hypothetical protein
MNVVAGADNAREVAKRVAFLFQRAHQVQVATSHALIEGSKGSTRLEVATDPPK